MGKKGVGQQTSRCKLNLGSSVSFLGPSHLASLQILYTCWLRVDVLIFSYFFHTILRCSCRIHWIPGMKKGRAAKQCKMRRTGPGHEVGSRFRSGAPKHEAPKPALFYGGQHQFFYSFLTWTTKRSQIENVWTWCTTKPDLLTSWVLHGRGKIWPQPPQSGWVYYGLLLWQNCGSQGLEFRPIRPWPHGRIFFGRGRLEKNSQKLRFCVSQSSCKNPLVVFEFLIQPRSLICHLLT